MSTISRRTLFGGVAGLSATASAFGLGGVKSIQFLPSKTANAAQGDDDRGTLIMSGGKSQFPSNFNPLLNDVRLWLFDGLVRFDEEMNPIPDLADSWDISEDGLIYTFNLRQDVSFHDETQMTAADVVFTAELTLDESINSPYRSKFVIDGKPVLWEQVDDFTVTATLPTPSSSFLSKCSRADEIFFCILPKHLLEDVDDITTSDFNSNPVGTGPFKFVSYVPDQQVVTEAHDAYHQGQPGLKQVVRLNFPNEQSGLAALQSGEIDISTLREAGNVRAAESEDDIEVHRYNSNWVFASRYNFTNPILAELPVREAINYAIDRENIIKAAVSPTAVIGNSPISIGWAANPDVTVFGFDPDKSRSILDEAGWVGDGIREKDGQKLSVTVSLYPDYAAPEIAAAMQQFLREVGIELNIRQLEYATFQTEIYENREFDLYLDWQGFGVDPDITTRWITPSGDSGNYLDNPSSYSNLGVDEALIAASTAQNQDERQDYLWTAQDLLTADAPCLWLYLWEAQVAVRSTVVGGLSLPGSTADMDNTGVFREPWLLTSDRS